MEHPSPAEKPVVYIFHGDDTFAIQHHVEQIIKQMGDPSIADLNISRLDGRQASDEDVRSAANALPFLTDRRVVIVSHPLAKMNNDAARKRFINLLDNLPSSTALVLLVEDTIEKRDWKSMPGANFVRRWANNAGGRAFYSLCQLPPVKAMPEWIRKEARRIGGQFEIDAAMTLAEYIGNDTRAASLEIEKLLIYVNFKRPVDKQDVLELTAQGGEADVFEMVDAMGAGNARQALSLLQRLLESQDPLNLFGMMVRQFRLLLQAREMLDQGRGGQIASELRLPPFVGEKLAGQARRFTIEQLEEVYHRLLFVDESVKTGQASWELAFNTLIAGLQK